MTDEKKPRDSQRSKVYKAEHLFTGENGHLQKKNASLDFWNKYLNERVVKSKWFGKNFRITYDFRFKTKDGRGCRSANARTYHLGYQSDYARLGIITLPLWARQEIVVLHEAAHVVTHPKYADHGPEFCRNFLKLVRHFMGVEVEKKLKKSFAEKKVRWKEKKRLSPEHLAKLRERGKALAAARYKTEEGAKIDG
jgi:putative metallohydrolase (TIGR04338 family)